MRTKLEITYIVSSLFEIYTLQSIKRQPTVPIRDILWISRWLVCTSAECNTTLRRRQLEIWIFSICGTFFGTIVIVIVCVSSLLLSMCFVVVLIAFLQQYCTHQTIVCMDFIFLQFVVFFIAFVPSFCQCLVCARLRLKRELKEKKTMKRQQNNGEFTEVSFDSMFHSVRVLCFMRI